MQTLTLPYGLVLALGFGTILPTQPSDANLRQQARTALKQAVTYYRTQVAHHGGYVYYTSLDLEQRWGEGKAGPHTIFVQPPGTPTVGMAYLKAYAATQDPFYRNAARETAMALVNGQLESGGWAQVIHFSPPERGRMGKYRKRKGGKRNVSSLDDGQTQAALEMLIQTDQALDFQDPVIHEAARYGLDALLKAQFPNGGFPQVWTGPVKPQPVRKARYPDYNWKTEHRIKNYWDYYTLNDNLAGDVAQTLITAHQIYHDNRYQTALEKLGDFLILAQMPQPQPGWCQQYNYEMYPMWARKFEPPAVTALESQDAMRTLIRIAAYTGDEKYLEPIPRALEYFQTCLIADGKAARFYELKTNKPLYMTRDYQLTYADDAIPSHYGWKQTAHFDDIERAYLAARQGKPKSKRLMNNLRQRVQSIMKDLDDQGRWVSTAEAGKRLVGQPKFPQSFRYLSSQVFARNVGTLSEFLATPRP